MTPRQSCDDVFLAGEEAAFIRQALCACSGVLAWIRQNGGPLGAALLAQAARDGTAIGHAEYDASLAIDYLDFPATQGSPGDRSSRATPATPSRRSSIAASCRTRRSASGPSGSLRITVRPGRNGLVTRVRSLECTISAPRNGSGPGRTPPPLASIGHLHTHGPASPNLPTPRLRTCTTAVAYMRSLFSGRAVGASISIWPSPTPVSSAVSWQRPGLLPEAGSNPNRTGGSALGDYPHAQSDRGTPIRQVTDSRLAIQGARSRSGKNDRSIFTAATNGQIVMPPSAPGHHRDQTGGTGTCGEPQIRCLFCKPICKRDAMEQDGTRKTRRTAGAGGSRYRFRLRKRDARGQDSLDRSCWAPMPIPGSSTRPTSRPRARTGTAADAVSTVSAVMTCSSDQAKSIPCRTGYGAGSLIITRQRLVSRGFRG